MSETIGSLKEKRLYSSHSYWFNYNGKRLTFPVFLVGDGFNPRHIAICPKCHSNNLRHQNWYLAKEYDHPLKYECLDCGSIGLVDDLEVVPLGK